MTTAKTQSGMFQLQKLIDGAWLTIVARLPWPEAVYLLHVSQNNAADATAYRVVALEE